MPPRGKNRSLCAGSLRQITDCVGKCVKGAQAPFPPSSILPDHSGATFVDLHVHHTPRVHVGGQVDLRELRLQKAQPDVRWFIPQQHTE